MNQLGEHTLLPQLGLCLLTSSNIWLHIELLTLAELMTITVNDLSILYLLTGFD